MKRILPLLLILALCFTAAQAEPLALLEDYTGDIVEQYDPDDASEGTFVYSWRYPHPDEGAEGGAAISVFYDELISDKLNNYVPMMQDAFEGYDSSMVITYTVTCNNDDLFSVLLKTEISNPDQNVVIWEGHPFSRKHSLGRTYSLPKLLGILDPDEGDEFVQQYQTDKADRLIREMVWDMIEENAEGRDYGTLTEDDLSAVFFPEQDFYLDGNGDPVFYIQPGAVYEDELPEDAQLFTFPISLEDILDEM